MVIASLPASLPVSLHGFPRFPRNFATPRKTHPSNPCQSVFKKHNIRVQIPPCSSSNHLPRMLHLLPQHRAKDHLDILDKRIMPIVIAIQPHLIGIDDRVVILHSYVLRVAGVAFFLLLSHILGYHFIFAPVL